MPGASLPASLARLLQAARSHRDSANPESPVVVVSTNGNFIFSLSLFYFHLFTFTSSLFHFHFSPYIYRWQEQRELVSTVLLLTAGTSCSDRARSNPLHIV